MGVEKLDLSKLAEQTLRQEALQTTFLVFLDIFYPPNFGCFEENGLFQHPRLFATVIRSAPVQDDESWPTCVSMRWLSERSLHEARQLFGWGHIGSVRGAGLAG